MANWTLNYRVFSSSFLTRVLVVMLLSCTNSNVILTVLRTILLIVLLICGADLPVNKVSAETVLMFKMRLTLIDLAL